MISPNSLFLASKTSFEFNADFISRPISSEMSLMWKTSSSAVSVFFSYLTASLGAFFFLSAATFYGSPLDFQVSSNRSLRAFPSTNGSFSLIFMRNSTLTDS